MKITKNQGFKCRECHRKNIPVLRLLTGNVYLYLCQRCIIFAFCDYAEKQWKGDKQ